MAETSLIQFIWESGRIYPLVSHQGVQVLRRDLSIGHSLDSLGALKNYEGDYKEKREFVGRKMTQRMWKYIATIVGCASAVVCRYVVVISRVDGGVQLLRRRRGSGGGGAPRRLSESKIQGTPEATNKWSNDDDCRRWSEFGECDFNPSFMYDECQRSCDVVSNARKRYQSRCPPPQAHAAALIPGQMRITFDRILRDFGDLDPEEISHDPPMILFHSFLNDDEAEAYLRHGRGKYKPSDGVHIDASGQRRATTTAIRTNDHAWCMHEEYFSDPLVDAVNARVSNVTQTPYSHAEYPQLVRYIGCNASTDDDCAFYRRHSDYIDGDQFKLQGARIYTLFVYLNDVSHGGETRFTEIPGGAITIAPQKGKALLWPSVHISHPHDKDERTIHEALPVVGSETKYGLNIWIHQYDFKTPHSNRCLDY